MSVPSNDLKKGDKVVLNNGWKATIEDNMRGNARLATVEGYFTEMGSIYVWDIGCIEMLAGESVSETVQLTDKQLKAKAEVDTLFK